jgi:hypothetical protein
LIKAISFIFKKEDITFPAFRNHYELIHAPLAQNLLRPPFYERNYVYECIKGNDAIGSISIFKYPDMQALQTVNTILQSIEASPLREDELTFMQPDKNYFYLVKETVLNQVKPTEKIFVIQKNNNEPLDFESSILSKNISDDLLIIECDIDVLETNILSQPDKDIYICSTNPKK